MVFTNGVHTAQIWIGSHCRVVQWPSEKMETQDSTALRRKGSSAWGMAYSPEAIEWLGEQRTAAYKVSAVSGIEVWRTTLASGWQSFAGTHGHPIHLPWGKSPHCIVVSSLWALPMVWHQSQFTQIMTKCIHESQAVHILASFPAKPMEESSSIQQQGPMCFHMSIW